VAGVGTIGEANAYLEKEYLPWWNRTLTVEPVHADDAHRPLGKEHDLAAILSHVEKRRVNNYTVRFDGKLYGIERQDIRVGLRGADVRVEERLDGTVAVRFQGEYLRVRLCPQPAPRASKPVKAKAPRGKARTRASG